MFFFTFRMSMLSFSYFIYSYHNSCSWGKFHVFFCRIL